MEAMLFAAGLGTRLKPLTNTMPKALVPVGGQPLLKLTLEKLHMAGAERVIVNVHHFSQQVIDYLSSHHFDCLVEVSDETEQLLDTGGGLKRASVLFKSENPILIHNVDILSNADLCTFYNKNINNEVTLLVSNRRSSRYLLFNEQMEMVGWTNVNTGEVKSPYSDLDLNHCRKLAFSGIHLFSPALFPCFKAFPDKFSITDFYISICDKVKIKGYVQDDLQLLDVGKLDTIAKAEEFLQNTENRFEGGPRPCISLEG